MLALFLIAAVGTDMFSQNFDFDKYFAYALPCSLAFMLVIRVIINYFKNKK